EKAAAPLVVWPPARREHQPLSAHLPHRILDAPFQRLPDAGSLHGGIDAEPVEVPTSFGQARFPEACVRPQRPAGLDAEQGVVAREARIEHLDRDADFLVGERAAARERLVDHMAIARGGTPNGTTPPPPAGAQNPPRSIRLPPPRDRCQFLARWRDS